MDLTSLLAHMWQEVGPLHNIYPAQDLVVRGEMIFFERPAEGAEKQVFLLPRIPVVVDVDR